MLKQIATDEKAELLWISFKQGDADAYGAIMGRYYNDLFNYGKRFTANEELIKDCIQNLFLGLWRNRLTINDTPSVKNYLLKSIRRLLLKELNNKNPQEQYDEAGFEARYNFLLPVDNNIILQERLTEVSFRMRSLIVKLTKRQQEVLYLRFYMDADCDEIAAVMELSKQTVYNHLHDALKQLKNICPLDYFKV